MQGGCKEVCCSAISNHEKGIILIKSFLLTFSVFGFDYCGTGSLFVLLVLFQFVAERRNRRGGTLDRKVSPDYRGEERLQF